MSGQAREGYARPLQGRGLLARQRRPKGFGGHRPARRRPLAPARDPPALIRPDPAPEPVAQAISWSVALRAGELADGGLGRFAAVDWCSAAKKNASRLPVRSRSIESMTWNTDSPAHAW